jgi:hypothetical protein
MIRKKSVVTRFPLLAVPLLAALAVSSAVPVTARSLPVTHRPSYVVLDNNGAAAQTNRSPCSPAACANGIQFSWDAATCYQGARFAPIAIVWTINQRVPANSWPLTVPCSTGLQLWWDGKNQLTKAAWVNSRLPRTAAGLAVCFQRAKQCSPGHCVTAGCLPAHVNGADIFFQGGDTLQAAEWLLNGREMGQTATPNDGNDVFWYGRTPPASPFATNPAGATVRHNGSGTPAVAVLGRTRHNKPMQTTNSAPAGTEGVDFAWYLPLYESGPSRGCHTAGAQAWTSPPLAFAYTAGGELNSRVTIPTCPLDDTGAPMTFNNINFSWKASPGGTTSEAYSAVAGLDANSHVGCQSASGSATALPASSPHSNATQVNLPLNSLPQPPAGTDGVLFDFAHDDYKSSCWMQGANVLGSPLSAPGHPRLGQWWG